MRLGDQADMRAVGGPGVQDKALWLCGWWRDFQEEGPEDNKFSVNTWSCSLWNPHENVSSRQPAERTDFKPKDRLDWREKLMEPISQEADNELAWEKDWSEERSQPCPAQCLAPEMSWSSKNTFSVNKKGDAPMKVRILVRKQGHINESFPDLHVILAWVITMRFKRKRWICETLTKESSIRPLSYNGWLK